MIQQTDIEKETKVYIPKIPNPQILTYRNVGEEIVNNTVMTTAEDNTEKRR